MICQSKYSSLLYQTDQLQFDFLGFLYAKAKGKKSMFIKTYYLVPGIGIQVQQKHPLQNQGQP